MGGKTNSSKKGAEDVLNEGALLALGMGSCGWRKGKSYAISPQRDLVPGQDPNPRNPQEVRSKEPPKS